MSIFGNRLRALREDRDLMSKDFAKQMNVEPSTVTNWEKGNRFPKEDVLVALANYFDVSIDYLLGRTDDPKNIVYSAVIDGDKVDLEFDKDYPHKLTPEEVEQLIKKLKEARFDVDGLIEEIQNKDKK